jgi:hypothetical protein
MAPKHSPKNPNRAERFIARAKIHNLKELFWHFAHSLETRFKQKPGRTVAAGLHLRI